MADDELYYDRRGVLVFPKINITDDDLAAFSRLLGDACRDDMGLLEQVRN